MTATKRTPRKASDAVAKVAVAGAVSDGNGGFMAVGEELPSGCDVASLIAKGLAK